VLAIRSDGNYGDGIDPFAWTGSAAILEQFVKGNEDPVKYGHCWAVAGLVTTCKSIFSIKKSK
jgi:transglutaminase 1